MPYPFPLMLFAAGFGTRMGALTADRPKPLIPVAGRALIDHALDVAEAAGVTRTVVNTHYKAEQIARHLAGRDVLISHEPGPILETGGGLRQALPLLGPGPVAILNSDAIWTGANPLTQLAAAQALAEAGHGAEFHISSGVPHSIGADGLELGGRFLEAAFAGRLAP